MVVSGRMDQPSSRVVSAPLTNPSGQKEQIMPSLPSHRDQAGSYSILFYQVFKKKLFLFLNEQSKYTV